MFLIVLLGVDLTGNSVTSLAASLEAVDGGSLLDPAVVLAWATRQARRAQLVLCLTGSNTVVDRNEVGSVYIYLLPLDHWCSGVGPAGAVPQLRRPGQVTLLGVQLQEAGPRRGEYRGSSHVRPTGLVRAGNPDGSGISHGFVLNSPALCVC